MHWRVPAAALRPLVPAPLAIDTFDGDAFVGIVPFTMHGVRPRWAPPVPVCRAFTRPPAHLRPPRRPRSWGLVLQPRRRAPARGVGRADVLAPALPYHFARMTLEAGDTVRYASHRRAGGAMFRGTARPLGEPRTAAPGTLEHFLVERYLLYAQRRDGGLRRGQVHHAPYPLQDAALADWDESLLAAAGIARPAAAPLVHFAAGVDVEILALI